MTTHQRNPYTGTEKSLVIGIDVGTTFSGVSYALLEPGKVPRIQPVTRFSGQREGESNSKVPSVICYDQDGKVIAVGPETDSEANTKLSEIEGVRRAQWFKLRLRPPHLAVDKRSQLEKIWSPREAVKDVDDYAKARNENKYENDILLDVEGVEVVEPEPLNKIICPVTDDFKTAVQVFTDFLKYCFKSAKEYIIETETRLDSNFTWSSIERSTYFVLTHPNGWEGKQQSQMRDAAVAAGLVDRSTSAHQITFVTEGEASFHFCLDTNPELHGEGDGMLVVDCGGGTIDLSTYLQTEKGGYEEIVSPDCLLQGSIFVTSRARDYFKGRFKGSQFGSDDYIEAMARAFDKPGGAKCVFSDPNSPYFVKFGRLRDNDRKYGITSGKFKIEGAQMVKFFEPAVQDIIGGITNQRNSVKNGVSIKFVLLVGGFGRSDYLYSKLRDYFKSSGIVVLRPDIMHINKAVADGSVSYFVDHYVSARTAKYSYGINVNWPFKWTDTEHLLRIGRRYTAANGISYIPGGFSTILTKGTTVTEEKQFRQNYTMDFTPKKFSQWSKYSMTVTCYKGQAANPPRWLDLEPDAFQGTCIIEADVTDIKRSISQKNNGTKAFYEFAYEVVILFGLPELKAYIAWKENGEEKRSDASIAYDDWIVV